MLYSGHDMVAAVMISKPGDWEGRGSWGCAVLQELPGGGCWGRGKSFNDVPPSELFLLQGIVPYP